METQKQIVDSLKKAKNVLVTVSNNPSVDQLAACIGLSLVLTKLDAHAAAVYSGVTPSTIEFLNPDETFEKTTDSLRDFIISLDKSKADKLRYKVEDDVVRIFITPYRTSITDQDLNFSQGDFNVDVVVALGVHEQGDLDQAITTHGRILHDATVITINNKQAAEMGAINWLDESASSLCEMITEVAQAVAKDVIDEQIATALLTGVVAETERFSNEKTTADTMKASAVLMGAGANQQLVATKLDEPVEDILQPLPEDTSGEPDEQLPEAAIREDGTLEISHSEATQKEASDVSEAPKTDTAAAEAVQQNDGSASDDEANYPKISRARAIGGAAEPGGLLPGNDKSAEDMLTDAPSFGTPINSFSAGQNEETFVSPMSLPPVNSEQPHIMKHDDSQGLLSDNPPVAEPNSSDEIQPYAPEVIEPGAHQENEVSHNSIPEELVEPTKVGHSAPEFKPRSDETLAELEKEVGSAHVLSQPVAPATDTNSHEELNLADLEHPDGSGRPAASQSEELNAARDAVAQAMASVDDTARLEPIQALNAQPLGEPLHENQSQIVVPETTSQPDIQVSDAQTAEQPVTMPLPSSPPPIVPTVDQQAQQDQLGSQAPPVPPPIMPPFQQ